jgi:hypothetical protein
MGTAEEYRRSAWECLKIAEGTSNPNTRACLLGFGVGIKNFISSRAAVLGSALRHVFLHYQRMVAQANARLGVLLDGGLKCLLRPGGEGEMANNCLRR